MIPTPLKSLNATFKSPIFVVGTPELAAYKCNLANPPILPAACFTLT